MSSLQAHAEAIAESYHPHGRGRHSAIGDVDCVATILKEIQAGTHFEAACRIAGVSRVQAQEWLKRGEAGEQPHAQFLLAIEKARGDVEARVTRNILKASELPSFWAAGMTYLERTHPERWGRRQDSENGPKVTVIIGGQESDVQVSVTSLVSVSSVSPVTSSVSVSSVSPDPVQQLEPISTGQPDIQGPIIGDYVNPEPAQKPKRRNRRWATKHA